MALGKSLGILKNMAVQLQLGHRVSLVWKLLRCLLCCLPPRPTSYRLGQGKPYSPSIQVLFEIAPQRHLIQANQKEFLTSTSSRRASDCVSKILVSLNAEIGNTSLTDELKLEIQRLRIMKTVDMLPIVIVALGCTSAQLPKLNKKKWCK